MEIFMFNPHMETNHEAKKHRFFNRQIPIFLSSSPEQRMQWAEPARGNIR